jgi:hypothetical protein
VETARLQWQGIKEVQEPRLRRDVKSKAQVDGNVDRALDSIVMLNIREVYRDSFGIMTVHHTCVWKT